MSATARERFLELLCTAVQEGALLKATLGKYRGADPTLQNLFIRPTTLKTGPHLTFVWRYATRDITKNLEPIQALTEIEALLGRDFFDAHLFTNTQTAQLETKADGTSRLKVTAGAKTTASVVAPAHDRAKRHVIPAEAPWLRALGVTNDRGQPREGMADKFRQIQKFAELLSHLIEEAGLGTGQHGQDPRATVAPTEHGRDAHATTEAADPAEARDENDVARRDDAAAVRRGAETPPYSSNRATSKREDPTAPLQVADMGSGKGYLTFAVAALLGGRAEVRGIEARPELVKFCNGVAQQNGLAPRLVFDAGTIADAPLDGCDILIALHACDTATDDALARGIAAGARLLVVAPCCQKELRRQLRAAPVLADALRHGIFQERQAEFATDALRAQLLEWAGYRTKVFEFISTEHTAKNLMIAAIKQGPPAAADDPIAHRIREFAAFYGIREQALAKQLAFDLVPVAS